MILCLVFLVGFGEYSPTAHGSMDARVTQFSVKERCWNARGGLPTSQFCRLPTPYTPIPASLRAAADAHSLRRLSQ